MTTGFPVNVLKFNILEGQTAQNYFTLLQQGWHLYLTSLPSLRDPLGTDILERIFFLTNFPV